MFDNYYEVFLADTRESREINYSIRYKTYCEEMGFENKHDFPREQEFDDHDQHSAHFIVRHKPTGHWVGAMRLIFQGSQPLPIVQYCNLQNIVNKNDPKQSVELSRLCVVKEERRSFADSIPPSEKKDESEATKNPSKKQSLHNQLKDSRSIIWGLFNAVAEYCYSNHIETLYFITTIALAKVLRKGGCSILNIGLPCYHKGKRYPFKKDVTNSYQNETWRNNYKNGYRIFSELSS